MKTKISVKDELPRVNELIIVEYNNNKKMACLTEKNKWLVIFEVSMSKDGFMIQKSKELEFDEIEYWYD